MSVSRRSRTWPTTGGGQSSPSSASPVVCSDIRTCTRARRGAPIEVREFSPARVEDRHSSSRVPRWFVWPIRPLADAIVGSTRISPAKSHAPYMPRCTRSQRSSSNSRNICLPTARTAVAVRPLDDARALGEPALRARRRHARDRRSCGRTGGRCDGRNGPRAWHQPASGSNELSSAASTSGCPAVERGSGSRVPSSSNAAIWRDAARVPLLAARTASR